jgi:Tol biopolymer transport system component
MPRRAVLLALALSATAAEDAAASRIVFVEGKRERTRTSVHLFSVAPDGSGRRQLTSGSGRDVQPAASRDGRRLAFLRTQGPTFNRGSLMVMPVRGGRELADPAWTANGRAIAFAVRDGIDVVDADGTDRRPLVRPSAEWRVFGIGAPSFSRDGRLLAVSAVAGDDDAQVPRIWVLNADGSGTPRRIARGMAPAFSPVANRLAYTATSQRGACVVSLGGGPTRCYGRARGGAGVFPAWSPDGRRLVFSRGYLPHPYQELTLADVASGRQRRLTRNFVDDTSPTWAR